MAFIIYTDSSASLSLETMKKYNLKFIPLTYLIEGKENKSYDGASLSNFYKKLREKVDCTTSCVNQYTFEEIFRKELADGNDVLYIAFSSGLSGTYQAAKNAAEELKNEFPERKFIVVDSLCAAMGQGLLVVETCKFRDTGKSIEETAKYCEDLKLRITHLFTVDDLSYLYRGGRLKKSSYLVASLVNIKPLMHVTNEGKLTAYGKVIGRKKSIDELVNKMAQVIENPKEQTVFINHGDCIQDAEFAMKKIQEKIGVKDFEVNFLEPVIGTHSGPGTLAIFFISKERF